MTDIVRRKLTLRDELRYSTWLLPRFWIQRGIPVDPKEELREYREYNHYEEPKPKELEW